MPSILEAASSAPLTEQDLLRRDVGTTCRNLLLVEAPSKHLDTPLVVQLGRRSCLPEKTLCPARSSIFCTGIFAAWCLLLGKLVISNCRVSVLPLCCCMRGSVFMVELSRGIAFPGWSMSRCTLSSSGSLPSCIKSLQIRSSASSLKVLDYPPSPAELLATPAPSRSLKPLPVCRIL
jgi:hypothetical protein